MTETEAFMADPLASARKKLERAEHHLVTLREAEDRFLKTEPYEVVRAEVEANGLEHVYRLEVRTEPPPELALILGDAIHNVRSALDHIVYGTACHVDPGLSRQAKKKLQFVVCAEPGEIESKRKEGRFGPPGEHQAIFEALQPCEGGPAWLPIINRLDNIDKHRRLTLLAGATSHGEVEPRNIVTRSEWNLRALEHGAEVVRLFFDAKPDVEMRISANLRLVLEPVESQRGKEVPLAHDLLTYAIAGLREVMWDLRRVGVD